MDLITVLTTHTARSYAPLTYPHFRPLLEEFDLFQDSTLAVGYAVAGRPIGLALAQPVDGEVTRNGEKPGFKPPPGIVQVALLQYPNPGFLEKVLRRLTVARKSPEVAGQPELVAGNQLVQQVGIATPQAPRDFSGFQFHRIHKKAKAVSHSSRNTNQPSKKTHGQSSSADCADFTDFFPAPAEDLLPSVMP